MIEENVLVIVENNDIKVYKLDLKSEWKIGRNSKKVNNDISVSASTVSREHGIFQKTEGIWFYVELNNKNGTVYNGKHIEVGVNRRFTQKLLSDGDVFWFGAGNEKIIYEKTCFGIYLEKSFETGWNKIEYDRLSVIKIGIDGSITSLYCPKNGTVINKDEGIAICFEKCIFISGNVKVVV